MVAISEPVYCHNMLDMRTKHLFPINIQPIMIYHKPIHWLGINDRNRLQCIIFLRYTQPFCVIIIFLYRFN